MAELATLEAPEVETDTETVQPDVTEGEGVTPNATDAQAPAQTEETTDPVAAAIAEGEKADLEALIEQRLQERLAREKAEKPKLTVREKHQEALKAAEAHKAALQLTDDEAQPFFDLANKLHLTADTEYSEFWRGQYQEAFYGLVPEGQREAFDKQWEGRTDPVPPAEFLEAVVEARALDSKAVKGLSLEAAVKKSPVIRKEIKQQLDARFEEGRKQGRTDPAGESGGVERGAARTMTLAQIDAMPMPEWLALPLDERNRLRAAARGQ